MIYSFAASGLLLWEQRKIHGRGMPQAVEHMAASRSGVFCCRCALTLAVILFIIREWQCIEHQQRERLQRLMHQHEEVMQSLQRLIPQHKEQFRISPLERAIFNVCEMTASVLDAKRFVLVLVTGIGGLVRLWGQKQAVATLFQIHENQPNV